VLISRLRGDSTRVQLRTAFRDSTGAPVDDITLQDADEVRVFSNTEFRPQQYVNVVGAVNRPGRYPHREGMTLRDAVLLAGGATDGAYLGEAEIASRANPGSDGEVARTVRVRMDADAVLAPFDNVLIMAQPMATTLPTVTLTGEVKRPGVYTLRSKDERLADVITRAGGLTAHAYSGGVHFHRGSGVGRLGVSLDRALDDARSRDNIVMQAGDSVHVPVINPVVRVEGAVGAPRAVAYVPGQPVSYYVAAAGGAAPKADLGRAFVLQPNGKVESVVRRRFLPDSEPTPGPGAVVTVPASETLSRAENVAYITATAQLLAGLATIIAILVR
ncbi:MAG TPA: SLBB domain-containing protein, partial [Gemmatimonadaceae bacterium]|nr:SLBB domain-containing protein [Gemmatimonadaceae bacterium]